MFLTTSFHSSLFIIHILTPYDKILISALRDLHITSQSFIHPSTHPSIHLLTQLPSIHSHFSFRRHRTQSQPPPTNSKTLHPRIIDRTFTSLKFNPFIIVLTPSLPHPPRGGEDPQAQVRAWCEVVDAPAWTCEPSRSHDRLFPNVFVPMCIHIFASVSILICTFWLASLRFMDARLGFCAAPSS